MLTLFHKKTGQAFRYQAMLPACWLVAIEAGYPSEVLDVSMRARIVPLLQHDTTYHMFMDAYCC